MRLVSCLFACLVCLYCVSGLGTFSRQAGICMHACLMCLYCVSGLGTFSRQAGICMYACLSVCMYVCMHGQAEDRRFLFPLRSLSRADMLLVRPTAMPGGLLSTSRYTKQDQDRTGVRRGWTGMSVTLAEVVQIYLTVYNRIGSRSWISCLGVPLLMPCSSHLPISSLS
jgi:hypothetical protein